MRGEPQWLTDRRVSAYVDFGFAGDPTFDYGLGASLPASRIILPEGEPTAEVKVTIPHGVRQVGLAEYLKDEANRKTWLAVSDMEDGRPRIVSSWQEAFGALERVFVLPAGFSSGAPLMFDFESVGTSTNRAFFDIGDGADVSLVLRMTAAGSAARQTDLYVRAGARVNLLVVYRGESHAFNSHRVIAEASAHVSVSVIQAGGAFSQCATRVRLAGRGSAIRYRALTLGNGRGLFDESCGVFHEAPDTHADVRCAAALAGRDAAISSARLTLAEGVTGSTTVQRSSALLLSEGAQFSVRPEFEARHDDVQCAHGAAISGLDPERLFYLRSRGLSRGEAAGLMVDSFAEPYLVGFREAGLSPEVADIIESAKRELITHER